MLCGWGTRLSPRTPECERGRSGTQRKACRRHCGLKSLRTSPGSRVALAIVSLARDDSSARLRGLPGLRPEACQRAEGARAPQRCDPVATSGSLARARQLQGRGCETHRQRASGPTRGDFTPGYRRSGTVGGCARLGKCERRCATGCRAFHCWRRTASGRPGPGSEESVLTAARANGARTGSPGRRSLPRVRRSSLPRPSGGRDGHGIRACGGPGTRFVSPPRHRWRS